MKRLLFLSLLACSGCASGLNPPGEAYRGVDLDYDGYDTYTDCDDTDPSAHPDAAEICDGVDNNCDGQVDISAVDEPTWYIDWDGDGFGKSSQLNTRSCEPIDGFVLNHTDCDDTNAGIYPGADEHCDEVDEDCDDVIDNDPIDEPTWYIDWDGDGIGIDTDLYNLIQCDAPEGYAATSGDCDDTDNTVTTDCEEV